MAVGSNGNTERSLEQTPTWAVAVVSSAFVIVSLILEQAIHHAGTWLVKRHKKALYEALDKLKSELSPLDAKRKGLTSENWFPSKGTNAWYRTVGYYIKISELMLMGFISLLLTVGQNPISKICIPEKIAYTMLPCEKQSSTATGSDHCSTLVKTTLYPSLIVHSVSKFLKFSMRLEGKYPLVSLSGMNQLHLFIFTLAVLHVLFSVLTIALATAKMRRWKAWEKDIETLDYQFSHAYPERFRFTQQTSFVKRHMTFWRRTPILRWVVCFFRQFLLSIRKVDYLTLRHGFIVAHLSAQNNFDFNKYIKRSMTDDFKQVVGISAPLWAFGVVFLLIDVYAWFTYYWISFAPLVLVLIIGMKLQLIIIEMALEIQGNHTVIKGTPLVQPADTWFWLGRPQFVLFLIHFTLFQNAFQIAYFLWIWWQFGLTSCLHKRFYWIIIRIAVGVVVQFLCSYITLPLYALVTQMGCHMKKVIFEEQIADGLKRWKKKAKKSRKRQANSNSGFGSGQTTPSLGASPLHLLHRDKTVGDTETPDNSQRGSYSEYETSDVEMDARETNQHPISKAVQTSNLQEMVESSPYPPRPTNTVLISETPEIKEPTERHSTSEDGEINSSEFSFVKL